MGLAAAGVATATTAAGVATAVIAAAAIVAAAACWRSCGAGDGLCGRGIAGLRSKEIYWEVQTLEILTRIGGIAQGLGGFFRHTGAQVLHHHIGDAEQLDNGKEADGHMNGNRRWIIAGVLWCAFAPIDHSAAAAVVVGIAAVVATAAARPAWSAVGGARIT